MAISTKRKRLLDAYRFPGFRPLETVRGIFGDHKARVITLVRRSKKLSATPAAARIPAGTTRSSGGCETCPAATPVSIWNWKSGASVADAAAK